MSLFGSRLFVSSVSLRKIDDGSKIRPSRVRDSFDLVVDRNCSRVYPPRSDIATEGVDRFVQLVHPDNGYS